MNTPETELPRRTGLGRLAVGALIAVGVALAAASPAMADNWKHNNGHGNKHWKHNNGGYYYSQPYYYQPRVVYVQPQPVYVQPAPVYVAPPPPVYYVQPQPVYRRPSVSIIFPFNFD
jgi:PXPV repeat (3 copies)